VAHAHWLARIRVGWRRGCIVRWSLPGGLGLFAMALLLRAHLVAGPPHARQTTVFVSGAWALYPLTLRWADAFHRLHPDVTIAVSAGGSGRGMADVLYGAADIGMVSRNLHKEETAHGAVPILVAKDAVFAIVSAENPALQAIRKRGVPLSALADLFVGSTAATWARIAPGIKAPIHVYTRSDACGAASAWAAMLGHYHQEDLKGIGIYGDPGLIDAVRRDPLGLGYANLGFLFPNGRLVPGIAIVPLDANGNGRADPWERIDSLSAASRKVASGRYRGLRNAFFVTRGAPKGAALQFILFATGDAGRRILNQMGGYVAPLASERPEMELR